MNTHAANVTVLTYHTLYRRSDRTSTFVVDTTGNRTITTNQNGVPSWWGETAQRIVHKEIHVIMTALYSLLIRLHVGPRKTCRTIGLVRSMYCPEEQN